MLKICGVLGKYNNIFTALCKELENKDLISQKYEDDKICLSSITFNFDKNPDGLFKNNNFVTVFSGNIFGEGNLKKKLQRKGYNIKNNTEFITYAYQEFGKHFIKKIEGIFSFAIWDKKNKELILVNDKLGLSPLYIHYSDKFLFSSEAEALIKNSAIKKELDCDAIAEFFAYGYIMGGKTFVKNITNLEPATILTLSNGKVKREQYFNFNVKTENESPDIIIEKLDNSFRKAIEIRTKKQSEVYTFLTGGWDTRLIAANLLKLEKKINAFTNYFKSKNEFDVYYAKKLADEYSMNHFTEKKKNIIMTIYPEIKNLKLDGQNLCNQNSIVESPYNTKSLFLHLKKVPIFNGLCGGELLGGCIPDINVRKNSGYILKLFTGKFISELTRMPSSTALEELKKLKVSGRHKISLFFIYNVCRSYMNTIEGDGWERPTMMFSAITSNPFLDAHFLSNLFSIHFKILKDYKIYHKLYQKKYPRIKCQILSDPHVIKRYNYLSIKSKIKIYEYIKIYKESNSGIYNDVNRIINIRPVEFIFFETWCNKFLNLLNQKFLKPEN